MLRQIYIRNLAVIDELRLDFGTGFHIFTGETGSGKSVLMEAVATVLGDRASPESVRDGAEEAVVEALFELAPHPAVCKLLEAEGLIAPEAPKELVIRRHVRRDGRGAIFINHRRSSLALLKTLAAELADYTGQHAQAELLDNRRDGELLDFFLADPGLLARYREAYAETARLARELDEKERRASERDERLALARTRLAEFDAIKSFGPAEEEALRRRRERIRNAAALSRITELAEEALTGGSGCTALIQRLAREVEKAGDLAKLYECAHKNLNDVRVCLEDIAYEFARLAGKTGEAAAEESLETIEAELFRIEALKRRHGPGWEEVEKSRETTRAEFVALEHAGEDVGIARKEYAEAIARLRPTAKTLTLARGRAAAKIGIEIMRELKDLDLGEARFEVAVETEESPADRIEDYGPRGRDRVTFLIAPNPGLGLKPVAETASGGESSRLTLAIKNVLGRHRSAGTLIFDEIDAGLGGAAAERAGRKLKSLADRFQVLCITHHAHIARLADRHFYVAKRTSSGRTITRVKILSEKERVGELARLIGGVTISGKNRAYAGELAKKPPP